jgi:hypothetical protein
VFGKVIRDSNALGKTCLLECLHVCPSSLDVRV